jgi:endonuclease G
LNTRGFTRIAALLMGICSSLQTGSRANADPQAYGLEIPQLAAEDELIQHTGFSLVYDETYEQSKWVAYELTLEETIKRIERSGKFLADPKVSTGTATNADYKGSGYDRGHLAPGADMSWSEQAMQESFYFSNISPQLPSFNRGIWKQLEERVRKWARQDTSVYVVTGPVLKENLHSIGLNRVAVPAYFYKVVLVYRSHQQKAIAFIIPNQKTSLPLAHFTITVDSAERVTGLNFFPVLPDEIENKLENSICLPCWGLEQ